MNILLIGNLPEDRQESMQRFTAALRSGLSARGHTVTVLAPRLRLARLGPRYRYNGLPKYLGYIDKFVLFPRELRRRVRELRPDVVHLTDHAGAVFHSALRGLPVLATCHDLLEIRAARGELPQQAVGRAGRCYQAWNLASIARLPHVACVSRATRADVLRLTGLPPSRVPVIPNALNYPYHKIPDAEARARLAGLAPFAAADGGFLLHVGGAQWYKNRAGLLAIYAALRRLLLPPPALVMVGPPLSAEHAALAATLGVSRRLIPLRGVSGAQLEALYTLAEGLLFPSWQEGFGWPVAEAQTCGCPVFASNRAPMTEVGGRSALYFDPADPDGAARTIAGAWAGQTARRALALTEARRWQPDLMLDAYEALYRRILLCEPST
ncbi:glycosyl transferase family 1 [Opitutaceae bacterium TAV5]|nr:glycosyl transferase family 1 [Opitutaceae bacterium TAV5]